MNGVGKVAKPVKIELLGVLKSYSSRRALDYVSLTIEPGQIVGLLGANGAGKTTLIRCLAGIAVPDKGRICFDEEEFRRDRLDLRRRIYVLPDFPCLFWRRTVLRNVATILRLYDADGEGSEKRVLELLREFDLLPLAQAPIFTLSRGQAYKAALVALIASDRELWLVDEPFASGMDPHGIDAFKRHARAAAGNGRTVIYSTQILDIAERFSDRACVIDKGAVHAFDTIENLGARARDKDNILEGMFRELRESGT
jgi:ABC-type multidrug transport system ATPase subunit